MRENRDTKLNSILIIGESCLDKFIYCDAIRLAPDLPVPVLQEISKIQTPGMAMNVHRNILSIHKNVQILTNPEWESISKTRYMHDKSNHMFFRVDTPHIIKPLDLDLINFDFELIVVSDYNKGFLNQEAISYITQKHSNVFLDTKKPISQWASKAKFIKINNYEYERSLPMKNKDLEDKIIVTKGALGATFQNQNYPVERVEVRDASGAGDSFMAALVVNYMHCGNIKESITFANTKASEIVKHKGVTVI